MSSDAYTVLGAAPTKEQLQLATWNNRLKQIEDQIFYEHFLLAWFRSAMDTQLLSAGGEQFELPLGIGTNPNGGMIDPDTGMEQNTFDPNELAVYHRAWAGYNLVKSLRQQASNKGSNKNWDIYKNHMDVTIESLKETWSSQIFNGSGTGKDANSIVLLVPATATTSQTTAVGGITPSATKYWWRSQAIDMNGENAASTLEANMLTMLNRIKIQKGKVELWVGDQTTAETYEKNQTRFLIDSTTKIGDNNYDVLKYKSAVVEFDADAPTGEFRALNRKCIKMAVDPAYYLKWTSEKETPNVPFKTQKQIVLCFNFCRSNPRRLGCLFNIS